MKAEVEPFLDADAGARLARLRERPAPTDALLTFFDELQPVALEAMQGAWRGGGLDSGHPLDGLLERVGWIGKRFDGPDDVHPLVFATKAGTRFSINPSLLPVGLVVRHAERLKPTILPELFKSCAGLLRCRTPRARLRMVDYRGVVSAAMIYDSLPISDHFRAVDRDTLVGAMDMRGMPRPFFFTLRRDLATDSRSTHNTFGPGRRRSAPCPTR